MTGVRSRRGKLVHAWTPHGSRRDLAPEDVPTVLCGKKLKGCVVTEDNIDCAACIDIAFNNN